MKVKKEKRTIMKLAQAINASPYETAEIQTEEPTIVIGPDEEDGGYWVSFQKGAMPPYSTDHANTIEDAEQVIAQSAYASALDSDQWEPIEGE